MMKTPAGEEFSMKVFKTKKELTPNATAAGTLLTDNKTYLKIAAEGGYLHLTDLQLAGKKRMEVSELLRGFRIDEGFTVE